MLHCFKRQMEGGYSRSTTWSLPRPIPDLEDTKTEFAAEVERFLKQNESNRLLLHVDEHRTMCQFPAFRRGAMQLAGSAPALCRLIATYLEPPDLPAAGSSKVCRYPIPMMLVDVSPLLSFDPSDHAAATAAGLPRIMLPNTQDKGWNGKAKRLLATLRVKLSLFLQQVGLDQLHIERGEDRILQQTFKKIRGILDKDQKLENKLVGAIQSFKLKLEGTNVPGAVNLLLGVKDEEATGQRYPQVVSLPNRKLSLPLEMLMAARDTTDSANAIFEEGQKLFRSSTGAASDYCDGALLERAFAWALACKAAKEERLAMSTEYQFQCSDLQDGLKQVEGKNCRVFTKNGDPCIDGIDNMKDGIMYHAFSEGSGMGTHKGFDIWFKTTDGRLVRSSVAHFFSWVFEIRLLQA